MKKLFIKYLLLSIVLLSGFSQLITYKSGANADINNSNDDFIQTEHVSYNTSDVKTYITKSGLFHFEKINCEIEITDSEDDEISSLKKTSSTSSYFEKKNAISTCDFIIDYIQQASFIKKFSHLISCKRYILLRVIRI